MSLYKPSAADRQVVEEFRRNPVGHHSPALQRVLNALRGQDPAGKLVLVCTRPHREYVLAELPARRGQPLRIHHNRVFHSQAEAEWEVFRIRWEQATGEWLDD